MTTEGHETSSHRGAQDLTVEDLRAVLLGDNADVRAQFLNHFGETINDFLSHAVRAYGRLQAFGRGVVLDCRAAWSEAFLFSAFNSSLTSCHLLISGLPAPAGNLMRHYGEAARWRSSALIAPSTYYSGLMRIQRGSRWILLSRRSVSAGTLSCSD